MALGVMKRTACYFFLRMSSFGFVLFAGCLPFHGLSARIDSALQPLYASSSFSQKNKPESHLLLLALDGVPYELVQQLKEDAYFSSFQAPSEVISTFPSSTLVGFTGLFQAIDCEIPEGYESKFFSIEENRFRGDTPKDYRSIAIPYKSYFHFYRTSLMSKAMMYAFPGFTVMRDMARIRHQMLDGRGKHVTMGYIGGTDGAGHVLGRRRAVNMLKEISLKIDRLRRDYMRVYGTPLEVTLYSDHGFHYEKPKPITRVHLARVLKERGLFLDDRLGKTGAVVPVLFGDLSSAVFYTALSDTERAAHTLLQVEGMDLVFYRVTASRYAVLSHTGDSAYIDVFNEGARFRYVPLKGDPFRYLTGDSKRLLPQSRETWWQWTSDAYYPDALFRVYEAFDRLAKNHPQIIVSTLPQYELGSTAARVGSELHGGLEGTHGGLFRSVSSSFVMTTSTRYAFPSRLSYRDVFEVMKKPYGIQMRDEAERLEINKGE